MHSGTKVHGELSRDELQLRCHWLEERLRQLVGTSTVAFVSSDDQGRIVDWNRAAEQLFGWRQNEVLGRLFLDTVLASTPSGADVTALWPAAGSPEDERVRGERVRVRGRRRNGETFLLGLEVWTTSYGQSSTLNAFAYELTQPIEDRAERCQMGALIDSTGEAIIGTDRDALICTWNMAAEETFAYRADEALGRPLTVLVPESRREALSEALGQLDERRTIEHGTVAMRKDGGTVDVLLTASLVTDSSGSVTGYSVVARDVTLEHLRQAELDETLHGLEAALLEARRADADKSELLADVAHQLRTPLAGIRASADSLLSGVSPAFHETLLSGMVRETSRAARLLTALVRMARLDEGHTLAAGPCDVAAVCQQEVARASVLSPELVVSFDTSGPTPDKIECDADALSEILANLLDNARRHAAARIDVRIDARGAAITVRVADDGPGLPEGTASHAFERFVSLDGRGGSGLGLPIARGLARAQGGDLAYEGGVFVLWLPAPPRRA